jgi:hypothetical protein
VVNVSAIRNLSRSKDIAGALRLTTEALRGDGDCPYLLVLRAQLIQLDKDSDASLADAEKCLLRAIEVDPQYLPALEEMAHFYDAVEPDLKKAQAFARQYLEQSGRILEEMQRIVAEQD